MNQYQETDIILGSIYDNDRSIRIKADFLYVDGSDLHLSSNERRTDAGANSPYRRALVHDFGDRLTLNYAADYPDGVAVNGITKIFGTDLHLDSSERREQVTPTSPYRRALVHDSGDKLTLNYAGDYPGGVNIAGETAVEKLRVATAVIAGNVELRASRSYAAGEGEGGASIPGGLFIDDVDVVQALQVRVSWLESQVATLQAQLAGVLARLG